MKTVLLLNNVDKSCGVQQWGIRFGNIVTKSQKYNIVYRELSSYNEYYLLITTIKPDIIVYNYHIDLMRWLTRASLYGQCRNIAIVHEGFSHLNDNIGFDEYIYLPQNVETGGKVFTIGRALLDYNGTYKINSVPTIGSFGFGFPHKQYPLIVSKVCEEFDKAHIRFNMPYHFKADTNGKSAIIESELCRRNITKPGITLEITHDFLSEDDNLKFLADNDINAFFYDNSKLDSSSGATDFALSVDRPIVITNSPMFRHLTDVIGTNICIDNNTITSIIERGTAILQPLKDKWSRARLLSEFEDILGYVQ